MHILSFRCLSVVLNELYSCALILGMADTKTVDEHIARVLATANQDAELKMGDTETTIQVFHHSGINPIMECMHIHATFVHLTALRLHLAHTDKHRNESICTCKSQ